MTPTRNVTLSRKCPKQASGENQNVVNVYDYGKRLIARVKTWHNPQHGGSIKVQIETLDTGDPRDTPAVRAEIDHNGPSAFDSRPPLVLQEHLCPKCEGRTHDAVYQTVGEWRDNIDRIISAPPCPFCQGSGQVTAVFYPAAVPKPSLLPEEVKAYEIWSEGYQASGDSGGAYRIGYSHGKTFKEAVLQYFKSKPDPNFDAANLSVWGCKLFDNQKDAQKSFG